MGTVHRGRLAVAGLAVLASLGLAACNSGQAHPKPTLNTTEQAELQQGQLLVKSCFTGTLLQQAHTVHLVFLSSATGPNGPAVVAERNKVFGCLHINDPAKRQAFINQAGEDALHGHLGTAAGRNTYFTVTLPKDVLAAGGTASGSGTSTAQPSIPGVTSSSSPRASGSAA